MDVYCYCGRKDVLLTAWTDSNPGRRFWNCRNQRLHQCGFFLWFDPPMCHRSVQIIPGLLQRIREYEAMRGTGGNQRRHGRNWKVLWVLLLIAWLMLVWVVAFEKFDEESSDGHGRNYPAISG